MCDGIFEFPRVRFTCERCGTLIGWDRICSVITYALFTTLNSRRTRQRPEVNKTVQKTILLDVDGKVNWEAVRVQILDVGRRPGKDDLSATFTPFFGRWRLEFRGPKLAVMEKRVWELVTCDFTDLKEPPKSGQIMKNRVLFFKDFQLTTCASRGFL